MRASRISHTASILPSWAWITLAEDEVFIMGDNRNHSTDSRSYRLGPVKRGYIQGRAVFLLSPPRGAPARRRGSGPSPVRPWR